MQDQVGGQNLLQRGTKRGHQLRGQVGDEAHRVRHDDLHAVGQLHRAHGRVQRGKEHVLDHHIRAGQAVEQRRFARVGVAHQGNNREGHFCARGAVQLAGFHGLGQLRLDFVDPLVNGPPVGLDLRLTRPADKAQTAALTFQMRPGPHKSRSLIRQRRQLHLQHTLTCRGAVGEDLEDQPCAVEDLYLPLFFEVALLHGRHRPVDQHQLDLIVMEAVFQLFDLAGAKQRARPHLGQGHNLVANDLQPRQRHAKRNRFGQGLLRGAGGDAVSAFQVGMQHPGAGGAALFNFENYSSPS